MAYPFWLNSSTAAASSCGVHGQGLACEDSTTLITLAQSQHPYRVSRIDYDAHTIFVVDDAQPEAFNTTGCPHLHFNFTIDPGTPLQLTHSDSNITFFYNCKKNASWPSAVELIGCPDYKTSSYVFSGDGYTGEAYEYGCEAVMVAPVLDSHKKSMADAPPATRYLEVLKGGFELNYSPKSDECGICERSGGWCGYGRNQTQGGMAFTCFCADGWSTTDHCGGHKNKNTNLLKVVLPIIAGLLILACMAFVRIWKYKASKRQKKEMHKRLVLGYLNASNETRGENVEFSFFSFEDIAAATDNFSVSKQIGRGGFGKVYKGKLKGVNEVAIKRLSKDSGQGIDEFKNEIVLIAKLQHRNLVRLLGCCIHEGERLLVYEYLPNKSLDGFLFDATKQYVLDWPTRFEIVKGVARGLLYLHQDSRLTIVHRDLKASNILLDSEMSPKISDFGMARIFCRNQHHANTNRVVGTYGYMSPEYVMGGAFSVKSDTYSFGVLLLEIVSGLKISSPQLIMNFVSLTTYAWRLWEDGKAIELVDSSVIEKCPLHEVLRCIHVGLLCVQDRPDDRPLISSVIFMLENGGALLPAPKQPAYSAIPVCETEQLRENMENYVNEVSITTLEGR